MAGQQRGWKILQKALKKREFKLKASSRQANGALTFMLIKYTSVLMKATTVDSKWEICTLCYAGSPISELKGELLYNCSERINKYIHICLLL